MDNIFQRRIYSQILQWKQDNAGKSALLIEGARRIGKSTIVEAFAKREYKSYILIDFNKASARIKALFDDLMDLDYIFLYLQSAYRTTLYQRESVIIFDEVQQCPKARQAIKYLVQDGRYDYIETGSLISIKRNTESIIHADQAVRRNFFGKIHFAHKHRSPFVVLLLLWDDFMIARHPENCNNPVSGLFTLNAASQTPFTP